jgi:uncharacterized membrane protein
MNDETCRRLGIMTEAELDELDEQLKKTEESGLADLGKYFDRIHDKLFQLNTVILAAYFALIAIQKNTSVNFMLIPVLNIFLLLYVDFRMMKKSRLQSRIKSLKGTEITSYGKSIDTTNLYSLASILATAGVTLFFAYLVIENGIHPTK